MVTSPIAKDFHEFLDEQKKGPAPGLKFPSLLRESMNSLRGLQKQWVAKVLSSGVEVLFIGTQAHCLKWAAEKYAGHWFDVVLQTLNLLHDSSITERLGFLPWTSEARTSGESAWAMEEWDLWKTAWSLMVELASARPSECCSCAVRVTEPESIMQIFVCPPVSVCACSARCARVGLLMSARVHVCA